MNYRFIPLILINAFLLVLGQISWKIGMEKLQNLTFKMIYNPYIVFGLIVYGFSTLLWLYILPKVEFSTAYPINSVCYIFSLIAGILFFNESLTNGKVIGTVLIMLGVIAIYKF